jgi:hypothetical protein
VEILSGYHREVWFGNTEYSQICVFKYEDVDGDGVYTPGVDEPLPDWYIELQDVYGPVASGLTNETGWICFSNLMPGTYWVIEDMPMGWIPTENATGNVTVEIVSGSSEQVWFGNARLADICGYKFFDTNLNGTWEWCCESAIEGWEIQLYRWNDTLGDWELYMTTFTDADGKYCFEDISAAYNYTVAEVLPSGWVNTTPASVEITDLMVGEERNVTFGNFVCVPGHTIGFWKNNALKHLEGDMRGFQVPRSDYLAYLAIITDKYGDDFGWLNFSDALCPTWQDKLEKAYEILDIPDSSIMMDKAQAQILSLLLTVELYGYTDEPVMIPDMGWGTGAFTGGMDDAVAQILEWYLDGNYSWAKDAADFLNNNDCDCYYTYNGIEETSAEPSQLTTPTWTSSALASSIPIPVSLAAIIVGLMFVSLMAIFVRKRK